MISFTRLHEPGSLFPSRRASPHPWSRGHAATCVYFEPVQGELYHRTVVTRAVEKGRRDHAHCQATKAPVFEAAMLSEEPVSCGLVCDMFEDGQVLQKTIDGTSQLSS